MLGSAVFRTGVVPGGALAGPWVKNELWNKARSVPSLDLRFADNKSLVDATTGQNLVTFTRASSGTYVDSQGVIRTATTNEARFDHSPATGESLGLLVEEQRTNSFLQSQDFSTTWTLNAVTLGSSIAAPDGTTTAQKLEETETTAQHRVTQASASGVTTAAVTFTVFAKAAERTKIRIAFSNVTFWSGGGGAAVIFDLSAGTASANASTPTAFSITPYPNGWYRCSVTGTPTSSLTPTGSVFLYTTTSTYAGTLGEGLYLWGAQLEAGAFSTSYIPTTTATVTRSADVASITGSNFSSWYRQDEGTFFWSGSSYDTQYSNQNPFRVTEGASLRGIGFGLDGRTGSDDAYFSTRNNTGITNASSTFPYVIGNSNIRIGGAFGTDVAASFSGSAPIVSSPAYVFGTENQIEIMGNKGISGTNNQYNGHTRRLTYWPQRLPNETLQRITQ